MEIAGLLAGGRLAIDTAIFIYFIEEHPRDLARVAPIFEAIGKGRLQATASALTLMETLVVPYRAGNRELASRYERILVGGRGLRLVPVASSVLRQAAYLRAMLRLTSPDAIHLASAVSVSADAFLTHDRSLPQVPGLRTVLLSELVG